MEQEITNRLRAILEYLKFSPSKLADEISINRSRLSHILNRRNNPTLEVIQGILTRFNEINSDWLLFGKGNMIREGIEPDPKDLFQYAEQNKKKKHTAVNPENEQLQVTEQTDTVQPKTGRDNEKPVIKLPSEAKGSIKRITVYFKNNEYQDFVSEE
jgi:transcriptional regulator with XRE-family HTH domain